VTSLETSSSPINHSFTAVSYPYFISLSYISRPQSGSYSSCNNSSRPLISSRYRYSFAFIFIYNTVTEFNYAGCEGMEKYQRNK